MEDEDDVVTKKKEPKKQVALVQVSTQVDNALQMPDGQVYSRDEAFVWLCNQVLDIKKAVA